MTTTIELDTEITKVQIAGVLRKAKVVRYRDVVGSKSRLRDIRNNHSSYSGIAITEKCSVYNRNKSTNLRPHWVKDSTGEFSLVWYNGYNDQVEFTSEQIAQEFTKALNALVNAGYTILESSTNFIKFGKVVA